MKKYYFMHVNICRSPAAHCVFQQLINNAGLTDQYLVDSAGNIQYQKAVLAMKNAGRYAKRKSL